MKPKQTTFLSLGSNMDDKLLHLKQAVAAIHNSIGAVAKVSSVYKTPAWGFEGNDFYNICIEVHTSLQPKNLLYKLLELEKELGRKEKSKSGYENRCIDIDIILYENSIYNSEYLSIPHPRAKDRKFVLFPLQEIHTYGVFPDTKKTVTECLNSCRDKSLIEKTDHKIVLI